MNRCGSVVGNNMHERPDQIVLGALLERSHLLAPDDLGAAVREVAGLADYRNASIYLTDYEQRVLVPVPPAEGDPLDIDTTMGGRAFRQIEVTQVQADDGGVRLNVPLLDGAERLGILVVDVDHADDETVVGAKHIATLIAELVISKQQYGDTLLLLRRRRPMDLAAEMRWSLLPPLTFTTERVSVSGILEPAYEIAGDAFDYALHADTLHLAVIDAMGHGLEASRMANLAVGAYRFGRRSGLGLAGTYRTMDTAVASQFGDERFVTGQLGELRIDTGVLCWINAGHPQPLLLRDASVVGPLHADTCLPIGLGDEPMDIAQTNLQAGDTVLFFTDGVVEARSPTGELFGETRLIDQLRRAATSREPLPEMMRRLVHAILDHEAGTLRDDATLLAVTWHGSGN